MPGELLEQIHHFAVDPLRVRDDECTWQLGKIVEPGTATQPAEIADSSKRRVDGDYHLPNGCLLLMILEAFHLADVAFARRVMNTLLPPIDELYKLGDALDGSNVAILNLRRQWAAGH
ncbi:MAG: hypothetical protein ACE5KM_08450 [Planctomycetaceae bacterium]